MGKEVNYLGNASSDCSLRLRDFASGGGSCNLVRLIIIKLEINAIFKFKKFSGR